MFLRITVKWDKESNVEHMWNGSPRGVCGSQSRGGKSAKGVWWNDVLKAVVERKEPASKDV